MPECVFKPGDIVTLTPEGAERYRQMSSHRVFESAEVIEIRKSYARNHDPLVLVRGYSIPYYASYLESKGPW